MSERDEFLKRFAEKREKGLQDIKFCVEDGDSLQREDFFAASNRLDRAIDEGRCARLNGWDRDPQLQANSILS